MAHLDATGRGQGLAGVMQAAVAGLGGPQVHHLGAQSQTCPAGPESMLIHLVGAAHEGRQIGGGGVGEAEEVFRQAGGRQWGGGGGRPGRDWITADRLSA